jgi:hypothetical protein
VSRLAKIVNAPGFDGEVAKARARLDAKDEGWNEALKEAASIADRWMGTRSGLAAKIRDLIIPTIPAVRP